CLRSRSRIAFSSGLASSTTSPASVIFCRTAAVSLLNVAAARLAASRRANDPGARRIALTASSTDPRNVASATSRGASSARPSTASAARICGMSAAERSGKRPWASRYFAVSVVAAETCAVADARGHGNHRRADETRYDTRQRALHSGDDDDDARGGETFPFAEQAVQSCDADVVDALDAVAHQFGGDRRFFRDGK